MRLNQAERRPEALIARARIAGEAYATPRPAEDRRALATRVALRKCAMGLVSVHASRTMPSRYAAKLTFHELGSVGELANSILECRDEPHAAQHMELCIRGKWSRKLAASCSASGSSSRRNQRWQMSHRWVVESFHLRAASKALMASSTLGRIRAPQVISALGTCRGGVRLPA